MRGVPAGKLRVSQKKNKGLEKMFVEKLFYTGSSQGQNHRIQGSKVTNLIQKQLLSLRCHLILGGYKTLNGKYIIFCPGSIREEKSLGKKLYCNNSQLQEAAPRSW